MNTALDMKRFDLIITENCSHKQYSHDFFDVSLTSEDENEKVDE